MLTSSDYMDWALEKKGLKTVANLEKHGFDAHYFNDCNDAKAWILKKAANYETYGFSGSATTRALGIPSALKEKGKTIFDHWEPSLTPDQINMVRDNQLTCDCLFLSANAISMTGEIVNVDGVGNRVSAMSFGPKKVIIIAGMNKVAPDLSSSLQRVREFAGPMRAKSLNLKTPCTRTGQCTDCDHPQRICRITTILHRKPMSTDISVILIQTSLGF